MPLPPRQEGQEWFLDWALRSPKQAGIHLTASWHAIQSLNRVYSNGEIESCTEYFGGIGAQALMIELGLETSLSCHWVGEFNPEAVAHLEEVLEPYDISVAYQDAYRPSSFLSADLAVLDFGDLTVWKTREGEKHRALLDRVFGSEPSAILLTDIACRYLHLHRSRYETLLGEGTCGSYETYLYAFLRRIQGLYGYTLTAGYMHSWSTVLALVPEGNAPVGILRETPAGPVGLEIF